MNTLSESIEAYYRDLGEGDPLKGARMAKKQLALEFFDVIIDNASLDNEIRQKAFFAKANYEFAENYEKLTRLDR